MGRPPADPALKSLIRKRIEAKSKERVEGGVRADTYDELRTALGIYDGRRKFVRAATSLIFKDNAVHRVHIDGDRFFRIGPQPFEGDTPKQ